MAVAPAAIKPVRFRRFRLTRIQRRNLRWGLLFISPWLFGFIVLGVFPILYTFYLSLTRYSGIMPPVFIGIGNYQRMVVDPLFLKAAYNTLYYTLLAVPIGVVVAMSLAMAMNRPVREVSAYRAIYYLPSILPVFAISFVFVVLLNPGYGLVNWAPVVGRAAVPQLAGRPRLYEARAGHDRAARRRPVRARLPGRTPRRPEGAVRIGGHRRRRGLGQVPQHHTADDDPDHPL